MLLPNGFCYQTDAVNNQVLLKPGLKQTDCPYVMSCWLSIPAVAEFFYYLSQKYYECNNTDISAFVVSNSAKAKFRFLAKNLSENLVEDIRSDSEKVTDILRFWCQILIPDEKLIWSDIAEQDL